MSNQHQEYRKAFWKTPKAIEEVINRGISLETADTFQLGYCPTDNYSPLNDRLLFPIFDCYGELLAYQGRALFDFKALHVGKFWHNPGDWKSKVLYGLHENLERIYEKRYCVLVEGPFDVLALYEAGIPAVAGLGTSFHDVQTYLLARFTKEWVDWHDHDKAGNIGYESVVGCVSKLNLGIGLTRVPNSGYKDPCDTLKENGKRRLIDIVRNTRASSI
jgi:DNA primase